MARLTGKVAVITGGSSGIGLATAKKFAEEGAYVFITGRRESELEKAKATIGQNVTTVQGDVAKIEDLDRLYRTVKTEKGKVDIVMANAGFVEFGTLNDSSVEHYDKTFGTNARGTFFTVQKALPLLRDGASIILVSSCVQTKGIPQYSTYSATKAAIRSFARSWTAELKDRNIRVNTLSPGATDTPIIDGQFKTKAEAETAKKQFTTMIPLGRLGDPSELASAALFLASSDSSYVTGTDLVVDGGWTQI
jgi:NAD(P)-dependent dehydrogenase (short-subunit alcohol dehydrogenase family)